MAVTLEEISGWLDQLEYKYTLKDGKAVLMTGNDTYTNIHFITPRDDGRIFEWSMNMLDMENKSAFKVKEHKYLQTLLRYLLQLNYTTKFGTWEYNSESGLIAFNVEIPLEDATMTFKQFERICSMTMMDTLESTNNIRTILETGEMPEEKKDEMMDMFKAMLAKAQKELEEATAEDGI